MVAPKNMNKDNNELIEVNYQPYTKRKYFFSLAEVKFYDLLKDILQDKYLLFAKVRICDLVKPEYKDGGYTDLNRIKSKHVDFVICDKDPVIPKMIIELDDSSHNRLSRQERDEFVDEVFANAGLPIVHIKTRYEYNKEEIIKIIQEAYQIKYKINHNEDSKQKWWQNCLSPVLIIFLLTIYYILS